MKTACRHTLQSQNSVRSRTIVRVLQHRAQPGQLSKVEYYGDHNDYANASLDPNGVHRDKHTSDSDTTPLNVARRACGVTPRGVYWRCCFATGNLSNDPALSNDPTPAARSFATYEVLCTHMLNVGGKRLSEREVDFPRSINVRLQRLLAQIFSHMTIVPCVARQQVTSNMRHGCSVNPRLWNREGHRLARAYLMFKFRRQPYSM